MTGARPSPASSCARACEHVFGLPGDQTMHALDGLYDEPSIQFVTTRHEQGTTYLADGYARGGGRPGVAFVVPGVGVYNAGAGLATAFAASSPVVLIAGQINRDGIGKGFGLLHEIDDQLDLVRPITVVAAACAHRRRHPRHRARGVRARAAGPAATGRDRDAAGGVLRRRPTVTLLDRADDVRDAADPRADRDRRALLAGAERPLIWAGGGVVLGDASRRARRGRRASAGPRGHDAPGQGRDRRPPPARRGLRSGSTAGCSRCSTTPTWSSPSAPTSSATSSRRRRPSCTSTSTPTEIGRHFANPIAVVGDAAPSLELLLDALRRQRDPAPSRADEVQGFRKQVEDDLRAVGPQGLMVDQLRAAIPDDGVLVPCTTTIGYMSHMLYPVYGPRTYLSTSYMGTLGWGFPAALGVKVARPDVPVVCATGDGGFLFAATELATAVQYGINTITVVYDDGAYGNSNRDQRERFHGREIGTELRNPDFVKFAESFGADAVQLAKGDDVGPALRDALGNTRPSVIVLPMDRLPSPF